MPRPKLNREHMTITLKPEAKELLVRAAVITGEPAGRLLDDLIINTLHILIRERNMNKEQTLKAFS